MRSSFLLFLLYWMFSISSFADLHSEFLEQCESSQTCSLRLNSEQWQGRPALPNDSLIQQLCVHKEAIIQASAQVSELNAYTGEEDFYIDPAIMTACLMAEHMLLYDARDEVMENMLNEDPTGAGLDALLQFAGKSLSEASVGFIQMRVITAHGFYPIVNNLPAEEAPSSIEGAYQTSLLADLRSDRAFLYMAAMLGEAVTAHARYADQNSSFDIRESAAVQCTMYQLGGAPSKSQSDHEEGRSPRTNYYGLYAQIYASLAKKIIEGGQCEGPN